MAQFRDEKLLQKIAQRIKDLRDEKGLSQEDVYNETEIHVARIETAKFNITISTLSKLCDYFGITLVEFFKKMEK